MRKIINPAICDGWTRSGKHKPSRGFCKIEYIDGRLSICGVIGPMTSGNCMGSAGQCVDEIREGKPAEGWNREMLDKFCDIWNKWHLNDMRPYCEHQKELGWDTEAREKMLIHHYRLNRSAAEEKRKGKDPFYKNLEYFLETCGEISDKLRDCYSETDIKEKSRGWVRYDDFEKGILCKPCPVCGYKYGTKWLKEEVPQDVIDWLFNLPDSKIKPAWI